MMRLLICVVGFCTALLVASCQQSDPVVALEPIKAANNAAVETAIDPAAAVPPAEPTSIAAAVFERRILPIMQSPKPSSCTECHLSGVELKDYIRKSQIETFAALVNAGLIDTTDPDKSKILEFIRREPERPSLISKEIRQQELEGFREWIRVAVNDPQLAEVKATVTVGPQLPVEVIRHARSDRVLSSFMENVWSEVGRCASCHSPDRNEKQVREHGERVSWIKLNDPEGTMKHMLEAGLMDIDAPAESLLLKKPLMQVTHGGGQKMVIGDRTYQQFRKFIDDYAAVIAGTYKTRTDLPPLPDEISEVSEIWLKIVDIPAKYDKMLLQADLYRWEGESWSEKRVATSDRPIFGPMKLWQHSLSLIAVRGSEDAKTLNARRLRPGRYLVRISIDMDSQLAKDPRSSLGPDDVVGEVEIDSRWVPGYGQMTIVQFPG